MVRRLLLFGGLVAGLALAAIAVPDIAVAASYMAASWAVPLAIAAFGVAAALFACEHFQLIATHPRSIFETRRAGLA